MQLCKSVFSILIIITVNNVILGLVQKSKLSQKQLYFADDYESDESINDAAMEDGILQDSQSSHLRPFTFRDVERIKRCVSFKFGLSETIEMEERDIMKDARTSFLPQDTTAIPRECLETLNYGGPLKVLTNKEIDEKTNKYFEGRQRRMSNLCNWSNGTLAALDEVSPVSINQAWQDNDAYINALRSSLLVPFRLVNADDTSNIIETTSALQSFWREQGTKESIRQTQAKTMKRYMDTTVNPCSDFYKFACGNWEKLHPIPRDKAGFDTFEMLRESLDVVLKQLLETNDFDTFPPHKNKISQNSDKYNLKENSEKDSRVNSNNNNNNSPKDIPESDNKYQDHFKDNSDTDHKYHIPKDNTEGETHFSNNRKDNSEEDHKFQNKAKENIDIDHKYQHSNNKDSTESERNNDSHHKENLESEQNSNFNHKDIPETDFVGSTSTTVSPSSIKESDQDRINEKTNRLLKHIVSHRNVLSQILNRYRRQNSFQRRKRLITMFGSTIRSLNNTYKPKSAQRKAKDLYRSCINNDLLKKRGIQPLLQLIENLGGWPVLNTDWKGQNFDWLNITANLRRYNNDVFIVQWVGPDIKNSDENIIQFDQTSLGLPTREYFLQDVNSKYLQAYQRFMSEVMHKLGAPIDVAVRTAAELISFETQLASITSPAEQRLNVTKLYKRMTLKELNSIIPDINWVRYLSILQQRDVKDSEEVVVYALEYMQDLVSLIADTGPRTVSNYMIWRFVRHRINNVDDRFEDVKQNFYHTLFGREESPSRWKVCIAQVNTNMGMALGSMFVKRYFDENSKRDTLKMTRELQQAFRDILKTTNWLDPSTKYLAELKVNAMSLKIGYPDFILNPEELDEKYAGIDIDSNKYFENTLNVLLHTAKTEQSKLHEAVNKTTWQTAPAIVNAYYSRNKNQIMFPAGILQPPFYHRHFPRSLNFGGIGVVIGHELTHGFDDKGRLFDRHGNIHKWWTDESIKGFDERARCIISQYSNYTVGEVGIAINGESTQGENIADNGGIRQAFHAYKRWLSDNPTAISDERMPGLNMTGEQLFFLNFGQVWCGAMRPEAVRNKLNTAIHSPGRYRVIGTLSNSKDFAREYRCPEGSPMNPVQKCSVW